MCEMNELAAELGINLGQETTTFLDWGTLKKEGYDTKGNWKYSCGLVVRKGERSQATYERGKLFTPQQWREQKRYFEQKRLELQEFPERLEVQLVFCKFQEVQLDFCKFHRPARSSFLPPRPMTSP